MDIGRNIRLRRKQLKMTQEQLALEANYDAGNLSRIENGKQSFPLQRLDDFAKALKCNSIDLIFDGTENFLRQRFRHLPCLTDEQLISSKYDKENVNHWIAVSDELSENAFAYCIKDERMSPEFKVGNIVVVDTISPVAGNIILAENNGTILLSKFRSRHTGNGELKFELQPLNNDYETLYSWECPIKLLGVVVEYRERKLK